MNRSKARLQTVRVPLRARCPGSPVPGIHGPWPKSGATVPVALPRMGGGRGLVGGFCDHVHVWPLVIERLRSRGIVVPGQRRGREQDRSAWMPVLGRFPDAASRPRGLCDEVCAVTLWRGMAMVPQRLCARSATERPSAGTARIMDGSGSASGVTGSGLRSPRAPRPDRGDEQDCHARVRAAESAARFPRLSHRFMAGFTRPPSIDFVESGGTGEGLESSSARSRGKRPGVPHSRAAPAPECRGQSLGLRPRAPPGSGERAGVPGIDRVQAGFQENLLKSENYRLSGRGHHGFRSQAPSKQAS